MKATIKEKEYELVESTYTNMAQKLIEKDTDNVIFLEGRYYWLKPTNPPHKALMEEFEEWAGNTNGNWDSDWGGWGGWEKFNDLTEYEELKTKVSELISKALESNQ